jgi:hypothetical protein
MDSIATFSKELYDQLLADIRAVGTDNLSFFGGGYTKEGGYSLQQNPEEFAALAVLLRKACAGKSQWYLEIGTASGGVCRFLHELCVFGEVTVIDDHGHHRWPEQAEHLGAVKRTLGPGSYAEHIGDSHAPAAAAFLEERCARVHNGEAFHVAFIDGDHTYEGVTADLRLVRPHMRQPGGLVILHDTVACEGVKRAWQELRSWCDPLTEFVGSGRPLGIGVGRAR